MVVLLLVAASSNAFSIELRGVYQNSESEKTVKTSFDISSYLSLETDEDALSETLNWLEADYIREFIIKVPSMFTAKEVKNGEANAAIGNALKYTTFYIFEESAGLFVALYYCMLLVCIAASIFGADIIVSLMLGENKRILKFITAGTSAVLTIVSFALNALYVASINKQMKIFKINALNVAISAASVFALIFTIVAFVCIFFFVKKERKKTVTEYTYYQE